MKNPIVTITMEDGGKMVLELYPKTAPNTVNNFVNLIQKKFYDGLTFHRIVPTFMIQGGDPDDCGTGGPGYAIPGEFAANGFKNDLKHTFGVISMARSMKPDSAGSQFFIMVSDCPHLDGNYAAFGKIIGDDSTLRKIATAHISWNDRPTSPQVIKSITVETFGVEYPEPYHTEEPDKVVE